MDAGKYKAWVLIAIIMICICSSINDFATPQSATTHQPNSGLPSTLTAPQIMGDFTLKYSVIRNENDSPAAKDQFYLANANGLDLAVKAGKMTHEQADRQKKQLKSGLQHRFLPEKFIVILSSRKGKLLYHVQGAGDHVYLWDGSNSYSYDVQSKILNVESGFSFKPLKEILCPGVGIPEIPMIKLAVTGTNNLQLHGDVYSGYVGQNGPLYLPGLLTFATSKLGTLRPATMEWRQDGTLNGRFEFSGQAILGEVPITRRIRHLQFNSKLPHPPGNNPAIATITEYSLLFSSDEALPSDKFDPASYLENSPRGSLEKPGTLIQWGGTHETAFAYHSDKTLEEQHNSALQISTINETNASSRQYSRHGTAGPILFAILLVSAIWWLIRRKRASVT